MPFVEKKQSNSSLLSDDETDTIHVLDITNGSFPEQMPEHIVSSDTIEFCTKNKNEYDIFQVYQDGLTYYRIENGIQLMNITKHTPENQRRIALSFAHRRSTMELYFCIIPSSQRQTMLKSRQCSKENCEKNCLRIHRNHNQFIFNDKKQSQRVFLHQGDTIELQWTSSKQGIGYRIEEKQYCPISGGLYKVEQTSSSEMINNDARPNGKFTKTLNEYGTSFFFRLTETNQIHDILVCIIKDKYQIKHIEITDTDIQPNCISIEQEDSIVFEWNTQQKQTLVQIDPFLMDINEQQSIELKTEGEHFFWPYDPSSRGYMIHQFNHTGVFCYRTANNQIGTIVVEPKINIHLFSVFADQLILKMTTNDFVQFEWKMTDSPEEPVLITIDANSSVVPDAAGGLTEAFQCSMHKCVKIEPFFRSYFHTCETFLLHIPQHGLYSFAYSDNRDDVLLNVIVEHSRHNHHVTYNEQNLFKPTTISINQHDQVRFESTSTTWANLYRTDEYGNYFDVDKPIFQPQPNSKNYFLQQFHQIGIYYFTTDMNSQRGENSLTSPPLAVIVLPAICFHYKSIRRGDFDSQAMLTNMNDFIIWQFEQIVRFSVVQLRSNETSQDLTSCHDRAVPGRNRQCLAVECIMPGVFYFANPEFERVTGSEQDRLISTIIIDPLFGRACLLITHRQFIPNVLCIAQNETISWISSNHDQYHQICIESNEHKRKLNEKNLINRSFDQYIPGVHYLYTFHQCGQFTIRSNRFNPTALVIVYPGREKKQIPPPRIVEDIDILSQFKTRVHLTCSNGDGSLFYTLDGTLPTRHLDNVHTYKANDGICFDQPGFHILRAYATENGKIFSAVITSSPTFVMGDEALETMNELRSAWNHTKIILSASIQYPNKLYGKIQIEPISSADLIDHFELYVDDVAQSVNLSSMDVQFSAEGFAGGEQYEIYVLAYSKSDATPIPSNRRAFEIKREIHGAPLISLAVSNEQNTIFLMWAHIGDHVSEYVVYVDDIERTRILEKDFNDFFGIQFHGAQQYRRYLLHVEAKLKKSIDTRKSNIITVNPPLEMPIKEQLIDQYFAYITVNAEIPPPDMRLEIIHLDHFPYRRPEPERKVESLPISDDLQDTIPTLSFKQHSNGVTLLWTKASQQVLDTVDNYQIIVDGKQYGRSISPHDEPNVRLHLSPGKHECYLSIIPKDEEQEICQSNILHVNISSASGKNKSEQQQDSSDTDDHNVIKRHSTTSDEGTVDPLRSRLSPTILKVTRIGLQMVHLSWRFDSSIDQSLIQGYRILINNKPVETLPSTQHKYELKKLEPGITKIVQISMICHSDSVVEKVSNSLRIVCPPRPRPPTIQSTQSDQSLSLAIQWNIHANDQDKITSFKVFLDGKLHGEIKSNGGRLFKYECTKLHADQTYSIYVKTCIDQKILAGSIYQCDIESDASNELRLKCAALPNVRSPRIERMHSHGVDIVWDAPVEDGKTKIIGYQILKNGRPFGERIPVDQRQASVHGLKVGNRYILQVVPVTNHSDEDGHYQQHYLSGSKLEIEYTNLVKIPSKVWVENISGHSAVVCWSTIDDPSSTNILPASYKLHVWNSKEQTRDQATIISISKDKIDQQLNDLQSDTIYEVQLEAYTRRRYQKTDETYLVSTTSDILTFQTGAPPKAPANLYVISSTNTAVRIGFDPFIEHRAEIIALRVHCESVTSRKHSREIIFDLTPDSTEFYLSNLIERTEYHVTIYALTDEYLKDIHCNDISSLPKNLKSSNWLTSQSLSFMTSGCEPASQMSIRSATMDSIELEWILAKAYGSTEFLSQILRWKLEPDGEELHMALDCNVTNAIIPGILELGLYRISLDSLFNMKMNINDKTNQKEIRLTISETTSVCYPLPRSCERPEVYLTGYTTTTIDLTWNKPNMFDSIDHPQRLNEQIKIHRKLLGYRVEINGRKYNTFDEDQHQCTLTECQVGEEYKIQLIAQTRIQNEYLNEVNKEFLDDGGADETFSKKLRVQMLTNQDLLRSFQANFEFHHYVTEENTIEQRNEVKPLGKINVHWSVSTTTNISQYILQWYSSNDLRLQQKTFKSNETLFTIDVCDEKDFYLIELIIVTNDGIKHHYEQLKMPIPGEPDAPKLWLLKTSNSSFAVEWSEPKSYGIPIIGFQLYVEGRQAGDMVKVNLRRAEIPSNNNRAYEVNVCALTNNPQRKHSIMSQTLSVITTPAIQSGKNDGDITHMIPVQIESINEQQLSIDWKSFSPTKNIRSYYIHYTCLNNGQVHTMKVSKRYRHAILRDLKSGFTYAIMVLGVDKNGQIVDTSEKNTIQMSVPPNAPIVAIRERTSDHVTLEWRSAPSCGELTVVGYKIFVNNRLRAILSHDQLTYILTNGLACEEYIVYIQALSNEKNISSPMSRAVTFTWPGIKPGIFQRLDDGRTGTIIVAWEHPHLEDPTDKLIGFQLLSENVLTHVVRVHGQYGADIYQTAVYDLINGKHLLWLEIRSEQHCARTRPITITSGRFRHRQSFAPAKCFMKKQKRLRTSTTNNAGSSFRQIQYS